MSYKEHAMREFKAAKWVSPDGSWGDEMQQLLCEGVLELLDVFSKHSHSGSSAPYAIDLFSKLAMFKPLVPLTGEDWEWHEYDDGEYQNIRCSHVFKGKDGVYDIEGKVFWEWNSRPMDEDEEGYPGIRTYKSYYTCRESRVPVTFPYTPTTVYEYRYSDAEPPAPPQTEEGLL